jgi:hypothetical protein
MRLKCWGGWLKRVSALVVEVICCGRFVNDVILIWGVLGVVGCGSTETRSILTRPPRASDWPISASSQTWKVVSWELGSGRGRW